MSDVLFISEDYLKNSTTINENVDYKILRPTIIMVQDVYLQPILGTTLYNDLKTKLIADVTLAANPNDKALIDNYISKVLIWYVKMESTMELKFHYMNKGVQVKSGENSQPADTVDLRFLMNEWRMKAEMYAQLLTDYLKLNTDLFPKYYEYTKAGIEPNNENYTLGIYLRDNGKEN